jgi:hypothetical protein
MRACDPIATPSKVAAVGVVITKPANVLCVRNVVVGVIGDKLASGVPKGPPNNCAVYFGPSVAEPPSNGPVY